jgi:hypothetical protein
MRRGHRAGNDDCTQAGNLYRLMSGDQKRQLRYFYKADPAHGKGIAAGLGMEGWHTRDMRSLTRLEPGEINGWIVAIIRHLFAGLLCHWQNENRCCFWYEWFRVCFGVLPYKQSKE